MGASVNSKALYKPAAEINVTPLVDVMLVLLIIFMVTAPMMTTGIKVNLPQAKTKTALDNKKPAVVSISKEGKAFVGQAETDLEGLVGALLETLENDRSRVIHIRADLDAPYGNVARVLDLLALNGMTRIAMLTSSKTESPAASQKAAPSLPASGILGGR